MLNPNPNPGRTGADPTTTASFLNPMKFVGTVGQYWGAIKDTVCGFSYFLAERKFNGAVQGLKASLTHRSANSQLVGILKDWEAAKNDAPPILNAHTWAGALKSISDASKAEKRTLVGEVNALGKALSDRFDLMTLCPDGKGLDALVFEFNAKLAGEEPKTAKAKKEDFVQKTMPKLTATLRKLHDLEAGVTLKAQAAAEAGKQVIEATKAVCQSPSYTTNPLVQAFCDHHLDIIGKKFAEQLEAYADEKSASVFQTHMSSLGAMASEAVGDILKSAERFAETIKKGAEARDAILETQHHLTKPIGTPSGKPQIHTDVVYVKISDEMANTCNTWLEKEARGDLDAFNALESPSDFSRVGDLMEKAEKLIETSARVHETLHKVAETLMPVNEVWDDKKVKTPDEWENDKTFKDLILCRMNTDAERDQIRPHVSSYFDQVKSQLEKQVRDALETDISATTPRTKALPAEIAEIETRFSRFIKKPQEFMRPGRAADAEVGFRRLEELLTDELNLDPAATARRKKEADLKAEIDGLMS